MDLTTSQWLAKVPNTSVAACFSTTGTMPSGVTPSEAIHQLLVGYRKAQETFNAGATAPPFISAAAPIIYGTTVATDDSGDYRTVEHKLTVRQYFDPDNASANTGLSII